MRIARHKRANGRCNSTAHRRSRHLRMEPLEPRLMLTSFPDWMADIEGGLYLSEFNIPGTHDSCSDNGDGYDDAYRTQDLSIREQLHAGIRFFDVRLWWEKDGYLSVHHRGRQLDRVDVLLNVVESFLHDHPTEAVIMAIKDEQGDHAEKVASVWNGFVSHRPDLFFTKDTLPTLDEARGKIVVLTRVHDTDGISIAGWPENDASFFGSSDITFYAEDHWNVHWSPSHKWNHVEYLLDDAKYSRSLPHPNNSKWWYINFTSAAAGLQPASFAWAYLLPGQKGVNELLDDYLLGQWGRLRLGTIVMNWPEYVGHHGGDAHSPTTGDLVEHILDLNHGDPTTVYVDDDYDDNTSGWGKTHFSTIQDGVQHVQPGGEVIVAAGTYDETVTIDWPVDVTLQPGDTTIDEIHLLRGSVDAHEAALTISRKLSIDGGEVLATSISVPEGDVRGGRLHLAMSESDLRGDWQISGGEVQIVMPKFVSKILGSWSVSGGEAHIVTSGSEVTLQGDLLVSDGEVRVDSGMEGKYTTVDFEGNVQVRGGEISAANASLDFQGDFGMSGGEMNAANASLAFQDYVQTGGSLVSGPDREFLVKGKFQLLGGDFNRFTGTGTPNSPYLVYGSYGLQAMDLTSNLDKHFVLARDIDLSPASSWNDGNGFKPIGGGQQGFAGSLDGRGFGISGIQMTWATASPVGLFSVVGDGGLIRDVHLLDGEVHSTPLTSASAGSLVGWNKGSVNNCTSNAAVTGKGSVGGLVGKNSGTITRSGASGSVTGSWDTLCCGNVGGLVGENNGEIADSYATASVTPTGNGVQNRGGLVGRLNGSITRSYAAGHVQWVSAYTGGLVGDPARGTVSDSYYDRETTGQSDDWGYGTPKTTAEMYQQATYAGWDFSDTWESDGQSYPNFYDHDAVAGFGGALQFRSAWDPHADVDYVQLEPSVRNRDEWSFQAWVRPLPEPVSGRTLPSTVYSESELGVAVGLRIWVVEGRIRIDWFDDYRQGASTWMTQAKLNIGEWNSLTVTSSKADNRITVYLNGGAESHNDYASQSFSVDRAAVGRTVSDDDYYAFSGDIDEVRIWDRALTAEEVADTTRRLLEPSEEGLLEYWQFDEQDGEDVLPAALHGTGGTLVGAPERAASTVPILFEGDEDQSVSGTLLGHHPGVKALEFEIVSEHQNGRVALDADSGDFTYTPDFVNWNGTDSFTYRVSKERSANAAQVQIAVAPVDDPPASGFGGALQLDGQDDYLLVDASVNDASDWTFEAWLKPAADGYGDIYTEGTTGGETLAIYAGSDNRVSVSAWYNGNWAHFYTPSGVLVPNSWNYVAVTLANGSEGGGSLTVYVNDEPPFRGELQVQSNATTRVAAIGANAGHTLKASQPLNPFPGEIDEVRIWNRTRSESDLRNTQHQTLVGSEPGLIAYWRLDNDYDGRAWDATGRGNDGALRGNAAWVPSSVPVPFRFLQDQFGRGMLFAADPDGDLLSYAVATPPAHGDLAVVANTGQFFYVPQELHWNGTDAFTWKVSDDGGSTWSPTEYAAQITVEPVNEPPAAGFGNSLRLDGQDDYVTADSVSESVAAAAELTLSAWAFPADGDGDDYLLAFNGAAGGNRLLLGYRHSEARFLVYSEEAGTIESDHTFASGQWHHVALAIGQENGGLSPATLYVDGGVEAVFDLSADTRIQATDRFSIGQEWDPGPVASNFWEGGIDEVRIWSKARSEQGLNQTRYRTLEGTEADLLAYWRLDEHWSPMTWDATGRGAQGQLHGDPSWVGSSVPVPYETNEEEPVSGILFGADVEHDPLTYAIRIPPAHGSVTLQAETGEFTYTPDVNFNGQDTFGWEVSDGGESWSGSYVAQISVAPVDDPPVAGFGNALELDGQDDVVLMGGSLDGLADWTFSAWVKPESSRWSYFYSEGGQGETFRVALTDDNRIDVGAWNAQLQSYWMSFSTPPQAVKLQEWNFVAARLTGGDVGSGQLTVFVNDDMYTGTLQQVYFDPPAYAAIGGNVGYFLVDQQELYPFHGQVDEVRIWGASLGDNDIRSMRDRTLVGTEEDLLAYWRLDSGATAGQAWDATGGNNTGEFQGDPAMVPSTVPVAYRLEGDSAHGLLFGADADREALRYAIATPPVHGHMTLDADTGVFAYTSDSGTAVADTFSIVVSDGNSWSAPPYQMGIEVAAPTPTPTVAGFGWALDFDGLDDFVEVAPSLNGATDWTFEAWVKPAAAEENYLYTEGNPSRTFEIMTTADGRVSIGAANVDLPDGWLRFETPADVIESKRWNFIAATLEGGAAGGGQLTVYVNGQAYHGNLQQEHDPATSYAMIGASTGEAEVRDPFRGEMDEVRIWHAARSASQIENTMHQILEGDEPNLVAYWRLDDEENRDIALDAAGANPGTVGGLPAWTTSSVPIPFTGDEDTVITGTLFGTAPEGHNLSFEVTKHPSCAGFELDSATGHFTYTPHTNWNGWDAFAFHVSSDGGQSWADQTPTVDIVVRSVNDPPEADDRQFGTVFQASLSGNVLSEDCDVHGGAPNENNTPVTVELVSDVDRGTLTLREDGSFTYVPERFQYTTMFSFQAADNLGAWSRIAEVTIDVRSIFSLSLDNQNVLENLTGVVVGTLSVEGADPEDEHGFSVSDERFEVMDNQLRLKEDYYLDHETEATVTVEVTATNTADPGEVIVETFELTVEPNPYPYHNAVNPADVNGDGVATVLDILMLVWDINQNGIRRVTTRPAGPDDPERYFDVLKDNSIAPLDVLTAIILVTWADELSSGEGEAPPAGMLVPRSSSPAVSSREPAVVPTSTRHCVPVEPRPGEAGGDGTIRLAPSPGFFAVDEAGTARRGVEFDRFRLDEDETTEAFSEPDMLGLEPVLDDLAGDITRAR